MRLRKMARAPKSELAASGTPLEAGATDSVAPSLKLEKPQSKSAQVLDLLSRPEGATIDQLVTATGWLPHTTRAVLTGFKKKGYILVSDKPAEGPRIYRVTGRVEVM
jgi:hypothetical protein